MQLLKNLTTCVSPSGRESGISNIIKNELTGICDEIFTDTLGNLICHKKGNGKKLMLAAHMDEIGFMVNFIDDDGFIRFSPIGGVTKYNSINSTVEFINGTKGKISYENKENPSSVGFEKMYIDIGAQSKDEAEKLVQIGDMASYYGEFALVGNRIMAKALDDRAGCHALIRAMQIVKNTDNDIYAVFTVQEEVGLRGAKTAAALISPDMAVSVDVSNVGDTPLSTELNLRLGKGPAVKMKDASFIIHESVKNLLLDSARESEIPYQLEAASYGGTDAGAIHLTGGGIASGTISIPTRYIHSASEIIDKSDLENTAKLLAKVMENPIEKYII
ncbi:MAG: M42 family metallopeptidase [Ruminococcaceae bacterium]|nr:M42 family metallopeptidase [Oscillospiraceae bacterium]